MAISVLVLLALGLVVITSPVVTFLIVPLPSPAFPELNNAPIPAIYGLPRIPPILLNTLAPPNIGRAYLCAASRTFRKRSNSESNAGGVFGGTLTTLGCTATAVPGSGGVGGVGEGGREDDE